MSPTGKSFCFVSFGRTCARSGCQVEFDLSPFPLRRFELSLFLSPTPQTSYAALVGLIGVYRSVAGRVQPGNRVVSSGACVRSSARLVWMFSGNQIKFRVTPFPFPFWRGILSLLPL